MNTSQNNFPVIYNDLFLVKNSFYDKCGFEFTELKAEDESAEYGASTFKINNLSVIFRIAKITPTKTGQFVTIWKRSKNGPIEPFHISDDFDLIIISTRSGDNFGQFIFPKSILSDKGIISGDKKEGKRAIRVYPPWDEATSKQAEKTQKWQSEYFFEISDTTSILVSRMKKLFDIGLGIDLFPKL